MTANFLVRKTLFEKIGQFDDTLFSGGDYQWNRLATQNGSKIIYSKDTMVSHPARYTIDQLRKKAKRVAAGEYGSKLQKSPFFSSLITLIYGLRPPIFEVKKIFTANQLSYLEKIQVWFIRYWFRSQKAIEHFKIKVSGKHPENS